MLPTDVVIVGAGVVGAACAWNAARAGMRTTVLDRGSVSGGTTGAGEGNVLVSDKPAGPELARRSADLWRELAAELDGFEYEPKGGLVVADSAPDLAGAHEVAHRQRDAGVDAVHVSSEGLYEYEPHLARDLPGGCFYRDDAQVQPMLAAARGRASHGATVRTGVEVTGLLRAGERVVGVRTAAGDVSAAAVVNAAGPWGGEVAAMAGVDLPVLPRRGAVRPTSAGWPSGRSPSLFPRAARPLAQLRSGGR